ncbi:MAG: DUF2325 domain-containing protein [Rubrivivax sp.]
MNTPADPTRLDPLEGWTFGRHDRCCAAVPRDAPVDATGSRRRRLWDLAWHAHCPVIGVCLPLAALRRLARKVLNGEPVADDYELHCGMVADCKHRTPMAEAVQRELDRRFILPLRRAAAMKTDNDLAAWWQEQSASKDLPGALWATLTHARCTPALENHVLGQVHMVQHQVGMATRVELARFEALIDENAVLSRELAGAQQRSSRQALDHARQVEQLQSELVRVRGQAIAAHSATEGLRQDLRSLHETVPQLDSRQALVRRNALQEERMAAMLRALQQARGEIERLREQIEAANEPVAAIASASCPNGKTATTSGPYAAGVGTALTDQAVLCVGGRTASVPVYRRLVESQGARFLHHDGGEEHSASQLESTLAAADLVICQAGCASHNAYWRVKDHCKRTGKRCVFVETPSRAALERALADVVQAP